MTIKKCNDILIASVGKATRLLRILKATLDSFIKDDCLRMSAALSFYSAFSLAPVILIAVAIAGVVLGDEAVRTSLEAGLKQELGAGSAMIIQEMVSHSFKPTDNLFASILGLVLLLIGAVGFFSQLQAALNMIWRVDAKPTVGLVAFAKDYLLSFSMVLVSGFLLLVSMILTTASQAISTQIGEIPGLPTGKWAVGGGVISSIVTMALFAAIFKILPNTPIQWRNVWVGAAFTTCLFIIGKFGIGWYLGKQATASAYGSAGSFAALLSWLYYTSMILLFGVEFTKTHTQFFGGRAKRVGSKSR
jgi:membrane protein